MAVIVVVVGALYLGRDILIPLALSILLSFMLAPVVVRMRRLGLGRIPAVLAVVVLLFVALLGLGAIVGSQIVHLADHMPTYEWNLRAKIRDLRIAIPSGGVVERTSEMLRDLGKELNKAPGPAGKDAESAAEPEAPKPVPVQVQEPQAPLQTLREVGGPLVAPIATAGLVVVFVIFMLLQREDLRDRMIRLLAASDVARATEAMDDAAKRISRYLLMQLVINVLYGIPVGVGLYFLGVPNPALWGLLATVLRFVPYVGPVIAALFPIALSFAVAPGWTLLLLTIALFVTLELFSNNVLEPWLYGSSTGLSPVAVLVAAVFWTTLWGPVGLLLSTPLTVCLVVLGRHVPRLGSSTCCWARSRRSPPSSSSTSGCWRATRTRQPSWSRSIWKTSRSTSFTTRSSCRLSGSLSRTGCGQSRSGNGSGHRRGYDRRHRGAGGRRGAGAG